MSRWFAVVPPGLEPVVARELSGLGISGEVVTGGINFDASVEDGARLSAAARSPARLLLRVAHGDARTLQQLARFIESVDWTPYFRHRVQVAVSASATRSRLYRRDIVASKVESALAVALRKQLRPQRGRPPRLTQRLLVRLDNDRVTLSLDAGGELLHRRGWRTSSVRAPLRENLASTMLIAAGWDGEEALMDPFCGSGTIPIEGALLASERAPWTSRAFAWEEWPVLGGQRPRRPRGVPIDVPIVGTDQDAGSIAACADNASRAGVSVDWRLLSVSDIEPPAPTGLIATNPPYGRRLGQRVRGVYVRFGHVLRERFPGWRVVFLAPNDRLARAADDGAQRLTTFRNGGIRVGLFIIEAL